MKIAVCYDNGNIFMHFGKTEIFKIYTTSDGKIVNSETIKAISGHEALASELAEKGVDAVICGGIGQGAADALHGKGIRVISGAQGDADAAAAAYLEGKLFSKGITCEGHEDHHHSCSCHGG